jgi:hypothetical protein
MVTQILIPPLMLVFVYVRGRSRRSRADAHRPCIVGTFGVTLVLSQLYLPRHIRHGVRPVRGLAMGIGGLAAVILGAVADAVDLKTALAIGAAAPLVGVVFSLRLPRRPPSAARRAGRGRLTLVRRPGRSRPRRRPAARNVEHGRRETSGARAGRLESPLCLDPAERAVRRPGGRRSQSREAAAAA